MHVWAAGILVLFPPWNTVRMLSRLPVVTGGVTIKGLVSKFTKIIINKVKGLKYIEIVEPTNTDEENPMVLKKLFHRVHNFLSMGRSCGSNSVSKKLAL